jgi:CTP:molybdopterin cytidylyltransferase MocA
MVIAAILLASGDAAIGGVPLALLPWRGDETLIEYHVAQLQAAGVNVIEVVLGHEADRIIPLVARDNVEPIAVAPARVDSAASIRIGATAVPRETDAAIVVRVDEPRPAGVYGRVLDEHLRTRSTITRASFEGTPGSPIVVNRAVLAELRNTTAATGGLDGVLARRASSTSYTAFEHGIVLMRIETTEEYARVREALG